MNVALNRPIVGIRKYEKLLALVGMSYRSSVAQRGGVLEPLSPPRVLACARGPAAAGPYRKHSFWRW